MSKVECRKGISLVGLIITIIVLIILTAAVVITGINTPKNTEYAIKMHNKVVVQDAVTLYIMTSMLDGMAGYEPSYPSAYKVKDVDDIVPELYDIENAKWAENAIRKLGINLTQEELQAIFTLDSKGIVGWVVGQEPIIDGEGNGDNSPDTPNNPEETEPIYYSSLSAALSDTTQTGDADVDSASVNVYTNIQSGRRTLQLQEDMTLTETLNIEEDLTLDLNGYTIESTATVGIRTQSEEVIIKGSITGSSIEMNPAVGEKGTAISVMSGECTIDGGTYTSNTSGAGTQTSQAQVVYVGTGTSIVVNDAVIIATDTNNGSVAGVLGKSSTTIELTDCEIYVESGKSMENRGVSSEGNITLTRCDIEAVADYVANAAGNNYASNSRGVWCKGALEMYDCNVNAAHAGVTVQGTVYIDGGSYSGYGHGGLYLAGTAGPHYFYNAEFNWAPMNENAVADTIAGTNGAGFYIGGTSNQVAYFDNCDFNMIDATGHIYKDKQLPFYGIVMRTSGGEKNNIVYISNSFVKSATTQMFRGVGTSSMTVYNGVGNDWSAAAKVHTANSTYFIDTEDSYANN